jgi:hypothetical protein
MGGGVRGLCEGGGGGAVSEMLAFANYYNQSAQQGQQKVESMAEANRGTKRAALSDDSELQHLRSLVIAQLATLLEKSIEEVSAKAAEHPQSNVLELGLTSAMGMALKGWVVRHLDAELTSFEILKQPLNQVVESIDVARREDVGLVVPALSSALPPAQPAEERWERVDP